MAVDPRFVDMCPPLFTASQVALRAKDPHEGKNGVIGATALTLEHFGHFSDGGRSQIPEHFHDAVKFKISGGI